MPLNNWTKSDLSSYVVSTHLTPGRVGNSVEFYHPWSALACRRLRKHNYPSNQCDYFMLLSCNQFVEDLSSQLWRSISESKLNFRITFQYVPLEAPAIAILTILKGSFDGKDEVELD